MDFWGPLQKVDYDDTIPTHGIFIETFRDHYLDFQPPTSEDVVLAHGDGKKYFVLSLIKSI